MRPDLEAIEARAKTADPSDSWYIHRVAIPALLAYIRSLEAAGSAQAPTPVAIALDQLHDEMANALMRFVQANKGLMNAANKSHEGVDAKQDVVDWGEAMGGATALAEQVLRTYAAVASGQLGAPPKISVSPAPAAPALDLEKVMWDAAKAENFGHRVSVHMLHTFAKAVRKALAEPEGTPSEKGAV